MHRLLKVALGSAIAASLIAPTLSFANSHMEGVTGVRKDFIASLDDAGGKLMELAAAVPQGKYNWKPGKGVRTTAEVYMHVAAANFGIPVFMGVMPPASTGLTMENFPTWEKTTTDRAKIGGLLKDSFDHIRKVIADTPDSDLDTEVTMFGSMKMSKRAALLIIVNHAHEHLGQSIAYARSNGVTPPWTAREQAAAMKAAAEKKEGGK
jgi:uncharacterized damage-inducible protein DinB